MRDFFKYWKLGKRRKVLCEVPNFECLITTFNLDYKPRDSGFKCETPKLSWFDRYVISGYIMCFREQDLLSGGACSRQLVRPLLICKEGREGIQQAKTYSQLKHYMLANTDPFVHFLCVSVYICGGS